MEVRVYSNGQNVTNLTARPNHDLVVSWSSQIPLTSVFVSVVEGRQQLLYLNRPKQEDIARVRIDDVAGAELILVSLVDIYGYGLIAFVKLIDETVEAETRRYCSCLLKVKSDRPYGICAKSTGQWRRDCGSGYVFTELDTPSLQQYARLHGLEVSPSRDDQLRLIAAYKRRYYAQQIGMYY
jgi:hypothetical protein